MKMSINSFPVCHSLSNTCGGAWGRRCRREWEEGVNEAEGRRRGDLTWPVGGLIPVLALELLSPAMAQIFRFGMGCHVGSEILCSRLLPPLFRACEEPWDGVKKGD